MELKEFIKTTLKQIADGIAETQKEYENQGININPIKVIYKKDGKWNEYQAGIPQEVCFDIALTELESSNLKGGIGVFLGGVGVGTKAETGEQLKSMSRIKFSVPIILPAGKDINYEPPSWDL